MISLLAAMSGVLTGFLEVEAQAHLASIANDKEQSMVYEIVEYVVMYSANKFSPRIWLKDSAGNFVSDLFFLPDDEVLPDDALYGGIPRLHYHRQDFQNVLDILRNEKPLFLVYNGTGVENGIRTSDEAVGEAET
jgi:hypothetical protein